MLELLQYLKENQHEDTPPTPDILCLGCASIIPYSTELQQCSYCGTEIDVDKFLSLYKYSQNALRYGHQYHEFYKKQKESGGAGELKPCLADMAEVYKYVALAIASGIIGGASWDLTKAAISKIIAQLGEKENAVVKRSEPTLNLEELDRISENINGYTEGLSYMEKDVAVLVMEEMNADSTKEYVDQLIEIHKLLEKPKKKEKNKKRAIKLQKRLIQQIVTEKLQAPDQLPTEDVWSNIER